MLERFFPITESWSYFTFFLYLMVTFLVTALCKRGAMHRANKLSRQLGEGGNRKHTFVLRYEHIYYFLAYMILVMLATLRSSEVGSDTLVYVNYFETRRTFTFSMDSWMSFNQMEPGFQLCLILIRKITNNYHMFFFFIYAFVAAAYIFYIAEFFDAQSDYLFLQIFIFFYVSNMSGMRSAMGMIFLLPSFITLSKRKYLKSIILTLLATMFHYTMLFNFANIIMVIILSSPVFRRKRWVMPTAIIVSVIVLYWTLDLINGLIATTKYKYYMVSIDELSFLGSLFLVIFAILLFCNHKKIMEYVIKNKYENIYTCVIAFLIAYPTIYLTGAYRIPNYYAMPRLTMWATLEKIFEDKIAKNSIKVFRISMQALVVLYLLFRFTRSATDGSFAYIIG